MQFLTRVVFAIAIVLALLLPQVDWRLWLRAATYPDQDVTRISWYRPLESVAGGATPEQPLPSSSGIAPLALGQVADYAATHNSKALLVIHKDQVIYEQYWDGFTANSLANGMSMTKTIVALLIGIALDEGAIDGISDPVQAYLTDWQPKQLFPAESSPASAPVTLEDLLYMQSGLRNNDDTTDPFSDLVQMYLGSDAAAVALAVPAERPPGQRYEYNNVNTQLLSLALEQATGERFNDYLSSRLWQPLQAATAQTWLDRPGGHAKTFCCLFASAYDWARVGLLLLHQGQVGQVQVVPADWVARMVQPSPLEPTFGYHIWLKARTPDYPNVDTAASEPFLADDTFYLDGRGFQRVYVIPSQDLVIVRLGEQPPNWNDAVIPNTLIRGLKP